MTAPATNDDTTWGMLCHISALAGFVIPFGNILGPLVVWLLKREQSPFVDAHGKAALNFNISYSIYVTILSIVAFVLTFIVIGILLYPVIAVIIIAALVMMILAAIKASRGEYYTYPFVITLVK